MCYYGPIISSCVNEFFFADATRKKSYTEGGEVHKKSTFCFRCYDRHLQARNHKRKQKRAKVQDDSLHSYTPDFGSLWLLMKLQVLSLPINRSSCSTHRLFSGGHAKLYRVPSPKARKLHEKYLFYEPLSQYCRAYESFLFVQAFGVTRSMFCVGTDTSDTSQKTPTYAALTDMEEKDMNIWNFRIPLVRGTIYPAYGI